MENDLSGQQEIADRLFMEAAMEEARLAFDEGEVPVGAVIVHEGTIVARDHNRVEAMKLGTAHAEMLVLRQAAEKLGFWRLDGCTLYVTKEPCPMCAGAMVNCRLPRLVFGCSDPAFGAAGTRLDVTAMPGYIHTVEVTSGILADRALELIRSFFRSRRAKQK